MATWLYQLSQREWGINEYRSVIWENEQWHWPVKTKSFKGNVPKTGDIVVFFYGTTGGEDYGFYGQAIVLNWSKYKGDHFIYFRPTPPSDYLKMHPWSNEEALDLANKIRGKMKQKTMWYVPDKLAWKFRDGLHRWMTQPEGEG